MFHDKLTEIGHPACSHPVGTEREIFLFCGPHNNPAALANRRQMYFLLAQAQIICNLPHWKRSPSRHLWQSSPSRNYKTVSDSQFKARFVSGSRPPLSEAWFTGIIFPIWRWSRRPVALAAAPVRSPFAQCFSVRLWLGLTLCLTGAWWPGSLWRASAWVTSRESDGLLVMSYCSRFVTSRATCCQLWYHHRCHRLRREGLRWLPWWFWSEGARRVSSGGWPSEQRSGGVGGFRWSWSHPNLLTRSCDWTLRAMLPGSSGPQPTGPGDDRPRPEAVRSASGAVQRQPGPLLQLSPADDPAQWPMTWALRKVVTRAVIHRY